MVLAAPVRPAVVREASVAERAERRRPRLHGVDLARGLAVVGMLFVDNRGSDAITLQLTHTPWNGLHVADVVFPVFLLIVGVTMPFSRRADRPRAVAWRVVKLALLGWLIVTAKYGWGQSGAGVLGHIAGAYLLCWLLLRLPRRAQIPTAAGVLVVLSLLYLTVPVPGAGQPELTAGTSWASWFDGLLGQGFGAEAPHAYLPSAITVFLGVLAGRVLQSDPGRRAVAQLALGGAALVVVGAAVAPVVPLNKPLWTPSYVLLTGGIGLLLLAGTHWLADVRGLRRPFRPAEILGVNAIVAFVVSELVFRAVLGHVQAAVVGWLARFATEDGAAYVYPALSVAVIWAVCAWLVRRGIVVRI
jgi:predicted acyltransferase